MKKQLINEDGFYAGSELKWGMDDVRYDCPMETLVTGPDDTYENEQ